MNDSLEKLLPYNGSHSIKEATITVFLVNKIVKPERFQKLIESEFKDTFKQFSLLSNLEIKIDNKNLTPSVKTNTLENTGFRFQGFDEKGRTIKVLQGMNEGQRTFISYHCLDYIRWNNLYNDYINAVTKIAFESKELFVEAFSLSYSDVFYWNGIDKDFKTEYLFNTKSQLLPAKFFDQGFNKTFLLTLTQEFEGLSFFDRIEIKLESKILPEITISHNIVHTLDSEYELSNLIKNDNFNKMLTIAHNRNKETLSEILNIVIQEKIKLL